MAWLLNLDLKKFVHEIALKDYAEAVGDLSVLQKIADRSIGKDNKAYIAALREAAYNAYCDDYRVCRRLNSTIRHAIIDSAP